MFKNLFTNSRESRKMGSIPGLGKSPGEGNGVFLPGKFHGQRSLAGYSPWGCKRVEQRIKNILWNTGYDGRDCRARFFADMYGLKRENAC